MFLPVSPQTHDKLMVINSLQSFLGNLKILVRVYQKHLTDWSNPGGTLASFFFLFPSPLKNPSLHRDGKMVFQDISPPSSRLAGFLEESCFCCPNTLSCGASRADLCSMTNRTHVVISNYNLERLRFKKDELDRCLRLADIALPLS